MTERREVILELTREIDKLREDNAALRAGIVKLRMALNRPTNGWYFTWGFLFGAFVVTALVILL
jgi:hypothetical protein